MPPHAGTGVGFATLDAFGPLLIVAIVGTLNPSSGEVSSFLPVEQAALAQVARSHDLTVAFAWYNLSGTLMGALGALANSLPELAASRGNVRPLSADRAAFVGYAVVALLIGLVYARLSPTIELSAVPVSRPLATSRRIVYKLAALFTLDSFGGGFAVQPLLVLWLHRRFALSVQTTGASVRSCDSTSPASNSEAR